VKHTTYVIHSKEKGKKTAVGQFKGWGSYNNLSCKSRKGNKLNKFFAKRFSITSGTRNRDENMDYDNNLALSTKTYTASENNLNQFAVYSSSNDHDSTTTTAATGLEVYEEGDTNYEHAYMCPELEDNLQFYNTNNNGNVTEADSVSIDSKFDLRNYIPNGCENTDLYNKLLELLKLRDVYIESLEKTMKEKNSDEKYTAKLDDRFGKENITKSLNGLNTIGMDTPSSKSKLSKYSSSSTNMDKTYNNSDVSIGNDMDSLCDSLYDFWLKESVQIMSDISKIHDIDNDTISINYTMRSNLDKIDQFFESTIFKHAPSKKSKNSSNSSMLTRNTKECQLQVAFIFQIQMYMYIINDIMVWKLGSRCNVSIDLAKRIDSVIYALDPISHSLKYWETKESKCY